MTREQTFDELGRRLADIQTTLNPPEATMDQAVTVGDVATVFGVIAGAIVLLVIAFGILSCMASGWDH